MVTIHKCHDGPAEYQQVDATSGQCGESANEQAEEMNTVIREAVASAITEMIGNGEGFVEQVLTSASYVCAVEGILQRLLQKDFAHLTRSNFAPGQQPHAEGEACNKECSCEFCGRALELDARIVALETHLLAKVDGLEQRTSKLGEVLDQYTTKLGGLFDLCNARAKENTSEVKQLREIVLAFNGSVRVGCEKNEECHGEVEECHGSGPAHMKFKGMEERNDQRLKELSERMDIMERNFDSRAGLEKIDGILRDKVYRAATECKTEARALVQVLRDRLSDMCYEWRNTEQTVDVLRRELRSGHFAGISLDCLLDVNGNGMGNCTPPEDLASRCRKPCPNEVEQQTMLAQPRSSTPLNAGKDRFVKSVLPLGAVRIPRPGSPPLPISSRPSSAGKNASFRPGLNQRASAVSSSQPAPVSRPNSAYGHEGNEERFTTVKRSSEALRSEIGRVRFTDINTFMT